ncbi:hypothetical protein OF83DRAFT_12338 [Amylostereum chailletii]|nr:hypothetical protein OF83DRAFT_12338 [Amylostereum chailletii]
MRAQMTVPSQGGLPASVPASTFVPTPAAYQPHPSLAQIPNAHVPLHQPRPVHPPPEWTKIPSPTVEELFPLETLGMRPAQEGAAWGAPVEHARIEERKMRRTTMKMWKWRRAMRRTRRTRKSTTRPPSPRKTRRTPSILAATSTPPTNNPTPPIPSPHPNPPRARSHPHRSSANPYPPRCAISSEFRTRRPRARHRGHKPIPGPDGGRGRERSLRYITCMHDTTEDGAEGGGAHYAQADSDSPRSSLPSLMLQAPSGLPARFATEHAPTRTRKRSQKLAKRPQVGSGLSRFGLGRGSGIACERGEAMGAVCAYMDCAHGERRASFRTRAGMRCTYAGVCRGLGAGSLHVVLSGAKAKISPYASSGSRRCWTCRGFEFVLSFAARSGFGLHSYVQIMFI